MTNELIINEENDVKDMIYEIRGRQVMLDSDLAKLYQCKNGTKEINQAVKNNIVKFPERFSFKISEVEFDLLKSKILTSKKRGGSRKGHRVFTEQGIAMLATILKTEVATDISIKIMDAFVLMRRYISSNLIEQKYINNLVLTHDNDIKLLQESFDKLTNKEYERLLDIISNVKVNVTVITGNYRHEDINKYQEQYSNLTIITNHTFHDRFIIIDNKILYHCGSSFKDLGTRYFAINKMEDNRLIEYIKTLI